MNDDADNRPSQQRGLVPWQPGQSGNPAGRPKGARSKLSEQFLSDVLNEWESNGKVAISDMREKNPGDFVKMVATLVPKEMTLNLNDNLGELSDDELIGQIRELHAAIAPFLASVGEGVGEAGSPTIAAQVH